MKVHLWFISCSRTISAAINKTEAFFVWKASLPTLLSKKNESKMIIKKGAVICTGVAAVSCCGFGVQLVKHKASSRNFASACQRGSSELHWACTNNTSPWSLCGNDHNSQVEAVNTYICTSMQLKPVFVISRTSTARTNAKKSVGFFLI